MRCISVYQRVESKCSGNQEREEAGGFIHGMEEERRGQETMN